jgi:hypothetical protein
MSPRRSRRLLTGLVIVIVIGGLVAVVAVTSRVTQVDGWAAGPASGTSSAAVPVTTTEPPAPPPPAASPTAQAEPLVSVQAAVQAAERAVPAQMTLGVAAMNADTGELAAGSRANMAFYAASIAKLLLAVEILDSSGAANKAILDADLKLLNRALSSSDDGAMNVLWGRYGGVGAITRLATRLGITAIRTTADPLQWGEVMVTAGDLAKLYRHILREMAPEHRAVIVGALATAQKEATDGFPQFWGLLGNGASERVYAKQGWVTYRPSRQYLHSVGVVHDARTNNDYAIVLLSIQSPNPGTAVATQRLTTVGRAAIDALQVP